VKLGGGATIAMTLAACYGPPDSGVAPAPGDPRPAADPTRGQPAKPAPDLKQENLGGIGLGATDKEVVAKLGEPARKGETVEEGATGLVVQDWAYPDQGLTLTMAADDGGQKVDRMELQAPSRLKTSREIGIGSSRADVEKAYGAEKDAEASTAELFVAGSVYGGVLFSFDGDKVSSIFIGAAAE
jgi:hypothetical protein